MTKFAWEGKTAGVGRPRGRWKPRARRLSSRSCGGSRPPGSRPQNAVDGARRVTLIAERLLNFLDVVVVGDGRADVHASDQQRHQENSEQNNIVISSRLKHVFLLQNQSEWLLARPVSIRAPPVTARSAPAKGE